MDVQSLGFRTDLALLALGGSVIEDRGDRIVVRTPDTPAYFWGNVYLLARPPAPAEVPELIAAYDADFASSRHRALGVDGVLDQRTELRPLVDAGLELDLGTVMTASSVHAPPRPNDGADYRALTSDDDWTQRVALTEAVNDEHEPEMFHTFAVAKAAYERGLTEAGHGEWWGAFVDGELVSTMGLFRASEGLARFQSVETHPDHRGRGFAGTLVHRISRVGFETLGARTLVMVADPDYLAIRVYRAVGFADTEHQAQVQQADRGVAAVGIPG